MTRLPLAPGATLTAHSAPGVGKLIEAPGNNKGVWVVGNARTGGGGGGTTTFSATIRLHTAAASLHGACVYAINYPPRGKYAAAGKVKLSGTPPFYLTFDDGSAATVLREAAKAPYPIPAGRTLTAFTDASLAPGDANCKTPAMQTLAVSALNYCEGSGVTLALKGTESGIIYQLYRNDVPQSNATLTGNGNPATFTGMFGAGTYSVQTVSDVFCPMIMNGIHTVVANPPLAITANTPAAICAGNTVALTATPGTGTTPAMTYTWNIGGTSSTTSVNSKTSQTLNATTTYTVQMKNSNGCISIVSVPASITVNPLPVVTANTPAAICVGNTALLTTTMGIGATSSMTYTWNIGGTSSTTSVDYKTSQALNAMTTYTVPLKNSTGCTGVVSSPAAITVNPLPVVTANAPAAFCAGNTVALTGTLGAGTTSAMTYTWNISGTSSTTSVNSKTSQALNATTTYTVQLKNSNGCTGVVSSPAVITVNPLPTVTDVTSATLRCGAGTISLRAIPSTGAQVQWYDAQIGGSLKQDVSSTSNTYTTTLSNKQILQYFAQAKNTSTGCLSAARTAVAVESRSTLTVRIAPQSTFTAAGATATTLIAEVNESANCTYTLNTTKSSSNQLTVYRSNAPSNSKYTINVENGACSATVTERVWWGLHGWPVKEWVELGNVVRTGLLEPSNERCANDITGNSGASWYKADDIYYASQSCLNNYPCQYPWRWPSVEDYRADVSFGINRYYLSGDLKGMSEKVGWWRVGSELHICGLDPGKGWVCPDGYNFADTYLFPAYVTCVVDK
jgi:hypothetical protein